MRLLKASAEIPLAALGALAIAVVWNARRDPGSFPALGTGAARGYMLLVVARKMSQPDDQHAK
eukprot:3329798-Alexandrium_andersonii.AAC.1